MEKVNARLGGVFLLGFAALLSWLCLWQPLQAAQSGAAEISTSIKGVALIPFGVLLGSGLLFGGDAFKNLLRSEESENPQFAGWVVIAISAVAGLGLYIWLDGYLSELGYG